MARSRRKFLAGILGALGSTIAVITVYPVFRYLSPRSQAGGTGQVTIPKNQVGTGQAHFFQYHGHPAVVLQKSPGVYIALSAICTHLGCIVQWVPEKSEFLCPCHGGLYASDGRVISGPPPKALPTIPVALSGDNLLVG
jgi:cytochrome b6-f complex iron-sulfur subunit